ncbi:MAG: hypothetical protein OEL20_05125 [Sulfuritalea sp.]|nr:hypothetical protein [Sulfuritalea sp.]
MSVEQFLQTSARSESRLTPWLAQIRHLVESRCTLRQIQEYLAANDVQIGISGISNYLARKDIPVVRARKARLGPPAIRTCDCERSDAEICRANGWSAGTLLTGDAGAGETVIRITAVGEASILAREVRRNGKPSSEIAGRETAWKLSGRDWREIPA